MMTVAEADAEKVGPHVMAVAARWGRLAPSDQERWERTLRRRGVIADEAALISDRAQRAGVRHVYCRGFALERLCPAGYARQFNDLDIAVADEEGFASFLDVLTELGYYRSRVGVVRRNLSGRGSRHWAAFSFNRMRSDFEQPMIIDVYLGGPSLTAHTHLWLPDEVFASPSLVELASGAVPVLDETWSLVAMIAECFDRQRLLLRDVLDLTLLEKTADVDKAKEEVARLCAGSAAAWAASEARGLKALDAVTLLESLAGGYMGWERDKGHLLARLPAESKELASSRLGYLMMLPLIEMAERDSPEEALQAVRAMDAGQLLSLGLSLYLFGGGETADSAERLDLFGRPWKARLRPLLDEDDLAADGELTRAAGAEA